jgi:pentapeptide repeat protein
MANDDHIAQLMKGVAAWNAWRDENPNIRPDLSGANLNGANLSGAKLSEANLSGAHINGAHLNGANLNGAYLLGAALVETDLRDADLTGCHIYGTSAWSLKLERTKQQNLVITRENEPEITVDNIEVAQFVYLLLHNEKIRDVIDTITSKVVLILGRFTDERKAVLDALREELRKRDYLPILFDFNVPATRDITETVSLLARMARFIIADLTDPSSIPMELEAIVPNLAVPVQPLLEGSSRPYAMFKDYWKYEWVLPVCRYEGLEPLLATLADKVIAPAEGKVQALQEKRRMIEAELTKPQ